MLDRAEYNISMIAEKVLFDGAAVAYDFFKVCSIYLALSLYLGIYIVSHYPCLSVLIIVC